MPLHDDGVANRKSFLIAGLQAALIALCIQHAAKLGECLGLEQNDTYTGETFAQQFLRRPT